MIARMATGIAVVTMMAACGQEDVARAGSSDLSRGVIRVRGSESPAPVSQPGICWTTDTTPAIIETVSEQVVDTPAVTDGEGRVLSPARYATSTHQRILRDRQSIHIRTPCPEEMTVEFVASVQRALKARGFYTAPVTGMMDAPTLEAVRRFQEPLGLDSPVLSLSGAKTLGLVKTELDEL